MFPSVWDESEPGSSSLPYQMGMSHRESFLSSKPSSTPRGAVGGFILIVVMALAFAVAGAPGLFVGLMFVVAVLSLIGGLASSRDEAQKRMTAELAEAEARDRLAKDVARSVRESMTGMIKVRCRYCGGLNGENDEKCESCGAPL
jgi:hypothetical protein